MRLGFFSETMLAGYLAFLAPAAASVGILAVHDRLCALRARVRHQSRLPVSRLHRARCRRGRAGTRRRRPSVIGCSFPEASDLIQPPKMRRTAARVRTIQFWCCRSSGRRSSCRRAASCRRRRDTAPSPAVAGSRCRGAAPRAPRRLRWTTADGARSSGGRSIDVARRRRLLDAGQRRRSRSPTVQIPSASRFDRHVLDRQPAEDVVDEARREPDVGVVGHAHGLEAHVREHVDKGPQRHAVLQPVARRSRTRP